MLQVYSFSPFGYEGNLVKVEVDLRRGIPAVDLVGLPDNAVKESRERMRSAIRNSGFSFPSERLLISLSPADIKKEGAAFDLALALAVLNAEDETLNENSEAVLVMGELELTGAVRKVRAVHAACSEACKAKITKCIVPKENFNEASVSGELAVAGVASLKEAVDALRDSSFFKRSVQFTTDEKDEKDKDGKPLYTEVDGVYFARLEEGEAEFSEVCGQENLIKAITIAVSGSHNLLAIGAPGCGKTMSLQKSRSLLPILSREEAQSVTRIYSLAGLLQPHESLVRLRPFRTPHQSASKEGLCGGGAQCMPGEITLAHNGVLFLDEAAEFKPSVLQILRVPLETGEITLSRAAKSTVYPAHFKLFMASNPCPCGNFGSQTKTCLCSSRSIELYWKKFSAPLLDRMDIRVYVERESSSSSLAVEGGGVSTAELRCRVARAWNAQHSRQGKLNGELTNSELHSVAVLSEEGEKWLEIAAERFSFSPRAVMSVLKIARTVADLEGSEKLETSHLSEAINYRKTFNDFMSGS